MPTITLLVSVYNEERIVKEKIENTLALQYPEGLLEVIVGSDGSTDRTNEIVSTFNDTRVKLMAFTQRAGKTACLNRLTEEAKGDILVFTDANSMLPRDALSKIARNFADPGVGLVTGWTRYHRRGDAEDATGAYSRLEKMTKHWESLIASCVGADGAIFALRRELYRPLDDQDINDFVTPLSVITQGKRVVLDPEVFCFEEPAGDLFKEHRRQVRITTRTLGAIRRNPGVLNPMEYGWFALFMISHKVIRFMVPFFLLATFFMSLLFWKTWIVYSLSLLAHLFFLCAAAAGLFGLMKGRIVDLSKTLFITLSAQFWGWCRLVWGRSDTTWVPQR